MNEHWLLRADNKLQRLYRHGPHRGVGSGVGYLGLKFWKHHLCMVDLYRVRSDGYLFVAIAACKALNDDSSQVTYSRCLACYFNARLSVELFLKALIIKNQGSLDDDDATHHIEKLRDKAYGLYPELAAIWDVPFCTQILGCDNTENAQKNFFKDYPLDQVLRYPVNKSGKVWSGYMKIEPNELSQSLIDIRSKMNQVSTRVFS
jgi:hypothetical protein